MDKRKTYSKTSIALHWITGLAFIAVFVVGDYLSDLPRGPEKLQLLALHKSFGVMILLIALTRIMWRIKEGAIPPASVMPAWQYKAAKAVHGLLMLATLAMPISGIAMNIGGGRALEVFGYTLVAAGESLPWLQELGSAIHKGAPPLIITIVLLHILAAIKHQVIDKDATIARMLGRG
ncbi:cytochrome b (plasmid) [Vibrio sp. HDW18]|uniref:cytochrome b n=1 Tax=Vibrio TaxID=662 RepID=UPI001407902B|nr:MULTISPECIES: cytochrome b [unclassified Vibrio]QIL86635.1 cytochrome b [Vibrio sp. HDW18]